MQSVAGRKREVPLGDLIGEHASQVDVTDPAHPAEIAHWGVTVAGENITVVAGRAYLSRLHLRRGVHIPDVADPGNPL